MRVQGNVFDALKMALEMSMAAQESGEANLRLAAAQAESVARRARHEYKPFSCAHEGYAVLLEEVDKLKGHVWKQQKQRDLKAMRDEALSVAAMALRFAAEVCSEERGRA